MDRPTLSDPAEYALIKKIYFEDHTPQNIDIDPIELLERSESKHKYNHKSSR